LSTAIAGLYCIAAASYEKRTKAKFTMSLAILSTTTRSVIGNNCAACHHRLAKLSSISSKKSRRIPATQSFLRKRSSSSSSSSSSLSSSSTASAEQPNSLPIIQRHGPNDSVITLNVGGKQFQTLRSTISQNPVLYAHVLRAESNSEYLGGDKIVFIDRDSKHFHVILTYLRNKADGLVGPASDTVVAATTSSLLRFGRNKTQLQQQVTGNNAPASFKYTSSINLPDDIQSLRELYFESIHYQITELTELICSKHVLARIFNLFGSNNPFQLAGVAYVNMKRLLVLFGGVMTGMGGWVYAQAVAAQAKTNELLMSGSDLIMSGGSGGNGSSNDSSSSSAEEYWKKQSKVWNDAAKFWNGVVNNKNNNDDNEGDGK
jgi:hypothetical protein